MRREILIGIAVGVLSALIVQGLNYWSGIAYARYYDRWTAGAKAKAQWWEADRDGLVRQLMELKR